MNRNAPEEPALNAKAEDHCIACKTLIGPFEQIIRGGVSLTICKEPRGCRARQPSMDEMSGGIRR